MTLYPITPSQPACYGVCCPNHGRCSRYAAVDHADAHVPVIATCDDGQARPLFIDRHQVTVEVSA